MKFNKEKIVFFVCLAGLLSVLIIAINYDDNRPDPLTPGRIRYLRDSLEMEYYKKALDQSYPFDHSKIPTNESHP